MEGVYIGKSRGEWWASLSALFVIGSVAAAILKGPFWVYAVSGTGAALALVGLAIALSVPAMEKPVIMPLVMAGIHAVLLVVGLILQSMFLSRLPESSRKIPRLQTAYTDPSGIFSLKGPDGWDFRPAPSSLERGVRMQPSDQTRYMGVSEANLFVRRLDRVPKSADEFLANAAATFSEKSEEKKLFQLRTEKGVSLSGAPVMWSELTIKRFWVPLYQVSVFGVKNGRYLCSVSATGLKSHADLSRLLCLGLLERIKITDKAGS